MKPLNSPRNTPSLAVFGMALWLCGHALVAFADSLRSQLASLAKQNGIAIEGLDRLGTEPARQAGGNLSEQLQILLADYNFMIVGQGNKIERLNITSAKTFTPRPKASGTVKTQRLGTHHQVDAVLSGPNNSETGTTLLIDTGATTVVLPVSMMAELGFRSDALQNATSQTAGGTIPIKTGVLKSVKVGGLVAENVPVSFVADQKLGNARLLGMSFLSRFRFSLDDDNNELQLLAK
jgi:aspartyl protease family protein